MAQKIKTFTIGSMTALQTENLDPGRIQIKPGLPSRGRMLIVDDYRSVSDAIGAMLTGAGFEVLCAENGKDTKQLVLENPDIQFCLVDSSLPDIRSEELAAWIHLMLPSAPILVMCTDFADADRYGRQNSVLKPISLNVVLQKMDELLNAEKPS